VEGEKGTPRTLEHDLDERSPKIHTLLEEWRDTAVATLVQHARPEEGFSEEALVQVFGVLFQATGTWFKVLREVVEARLFPERASRAASEFAGAAYRNLVEVPLFPGE